MISWYDRHPFRGPGSWLLQKAGEYSYSVYLLHFFVVAGAADFVNTRVMALPTIYHALPWAMLFFLGMVAVGHVSWKLIESPPLRWRKPYIYSEAGVPTFAPPSGSLSREP
jgi:peptidoglycan/LPS O-acetylase OafA/YrhL